MKGFLAATIPALMVSSVLMAQSISVKDVPVDQESTTIEIKKGKQAIADSSKKQYQIMEEVSEVAGEPAPLMKEARANWNKACSDWKKEVKELNTENKVLTLNCGKPQCQTTTMETTCTSDAKSKIKIAITD